MDYPSSLTVNPLRIEDLSDQVQSFVTKLIQKPMTVTQDYFEILVLTKVFIWVLEISK